jgi:hypothetical protein
MATVSNITSDGASSAISFAGGTANISVFGTFDGAFANVQYSRDGGATFITLVEGLNGPALSFRRDGGITVDLPPCDVRAFVSQAGASTNLTLETEAV